MFMYKKVAAAPTPTSGVNLKLLLFRRKSPLQNHLFRTKKVQFYASECAAGAFPTFHLT